MSTSPMADERVKNVRIARDTFSVDLMDGRTITVPLAWFPRLAGATRKQLASWCVVASGYGVRWPEIDEDLSTSGLLRAQGADTPDDEPAPRQPRPRRAAVGNR